MTSAESELLVGKLSSLDLKNKIKINIEPIIPDPEKTECSEVISEAVVLEGNTSPDTVKCAKCFVKKALTCYKLHRGKYTKCCVDCLEVAKLRRANKKIKKDINEAQAEEVEQFIPVTDE